MSEILLTEQASCATPAADKHSLYVHTSGRLRVKDEAGVEYVLMRVGDAIDGTPVGINAPAAGAFATLSINAIDQAQTNAQMTYGLSYAIEQAGIANKRVTDATSYQTQTGTATITQAASTELVRTYASVAVVLPKPYTGTDYQVVAEIESAAPFDGCAGQVLVKNRATNGFTLAITGSATSTVIRWKTLHPNAK